MTSSGTILALLVVGLILVDALPAHSASPATGEGAIAQEAESGGYLRWRKGDRRVDARLKNWPLERALERIAAGTGWQVLLEPGLDVRVAARFTDRPERAALAELLSGVNYALLPAEAPGGPSRLLIFRSSASQATREIKAASTTDDPRRLDRELVVRLKKGGAGDIQTLARKLGARVAGSVDSLEAHRLLFDDAEAAERARRALAEEEGVESVESNYAIGAPSQMERLPGVTAPSPSLKARPISDGSTVVIALLDTAVPASGTAHPDFLLPGVNVAGQPATDGGLSHGPAMYETLLQGLAMGQSGGSDSGQPVRVLPIDVYGGKPETSTFELAQGVVVALERGADLLNLSLAGPNPSPLLHDVLRQASQAGVTAFAAPGNEPTTSANYPAAYPEVVAVTAGDSQGRIAPYANRGSYVDLIAPGTSVVPYQGEAWVVNGTSVATAYASGLAAGLLADSGRPTSEVLAQMRAKIGFTPPASGTASPVPVPGPVTPSP